MYPAVPVVESFVDALVERTRSSLVQIASEGRGFGSGFVFESGRLLTNYHVVRHSEVVEVILWDGRQIAGVVTAAERALDLAVVEVEEYELPAIAIIDSSRLRVGEIVVAMGHPWGQRGVVTAGIVSGLGRLHAGSQGPQVGVIRSDVRLAPGSSGGPLLNSAGQVVGINSMIFGGDLSVAISSHSALEWLQRLEEPVELAVAV